MPGKLPFVVVVVALAVGSVGASGSTSEATVQVSHQSATLYFGEGRQTVSFRLREPTGFILLYRMSAPNGMRVRGFAQLRGATVPLRIATLPPSRSSGCSKSGTRLICSGSAGGCPMPPGVWTFRFTKLDGPAGVVRVQFQVGTPKP